MNKSESRLIRRIYRNKDIKKIEDKINMLGDTKLDAITFINIRLITTIVVFIIVLYITNLGYVFAPFFAIVYYYLFYYTLIHLPLKKRALKLDHEALYFFEILTLTLESGRNLENSLEITIVNVESELSNEFKKSLLEIKFGKSLVESLDNMKNRIPSETINNIILNMIQTTIFGSNIFDTMYNQIEFLRDKQLLGIKAQINKIPNKISIVSVVFIVPIILALILGPFVINFLS